MKFRTSSEQNLRCVISRTAIYLSKTKLLNNSPKVSFSQRNYLYLGDIIDENLLEEETRKIKFNNTR